MDDNDKKAVRKDDDAAAAAATAAFPEETPGASFLGSSCSSNVLYLEEDDAVDAAVTVARR